jgi:hypothetical protein
VDLGNGTAWRESGPNSLCQLQGRTTSLKGWSEDRSTGGSGVHQSNSGVVLTMKPALEVVLITAALGACATEQLPPIRWVRIGPPASQHQLDGDWLSCRAVANARMSAIQRPDPSGASRGLGLSHAMESYAYGRSVRDAHDVVLFGCMSDRGWVRASR